MPRRNSWSKKIEEAGLRARLYTRPRGASVYFSLVLDDKKIQRSTNRADRKEAETYTREVLRRIAEDRLLGRSGPVTLGEVFAVYAKHKEPLLSPDWRKMAKARRGLFLEAWRASMLVDDIGQSHVDRYTRSRMSGELHPTHKFMRKDARVQAGTIDGEFRWLSSVFNFAVSFKVNGQRLLSMNPLRDVDWKREKNPKRPVASHERYVKTMEHVDAVDPTGALGCILTLARFTGRRETAICRLLATDFLRDADAIRKVLASMGMDENAAEYMPHGAIHWSAEVDKMGYASVTPISSQVRDALDTYLALSPRMGAVPLFPAPKDPSGTDLTSVGRQASREGREGREAPEAPGRRLPSLQAAVGDREEAPTGR